MGEWLPEAGVTTLALATARSLFGPATREFGEGIRRWSSYRAGNASRVIDHAIGRIGDQINEPGFVHPRVAAHVLEEGSWSDDELMQGYFGGVLAAARTPHGRDDRARKWSALVSTMSVYELRTHYLLYRSLREQRTGSPADFTQTEVLKANVVWLPLAEYGNAMQLGDDEPRPFEMAEQCLAGLDRAKLIIASWGALRAGHDILRLQPWEDGDGLVATPSFSGMELFAWAHGFASSSANTMLDPTLDFSTEGGPPDTPGAQVFEPRW